MKGITITTMAAACCLAVTTANKLPPTSSSTFGIGRTTTFARGGAIGKSFAICICCYIVLCVLQFIVLLQSGDYVGLYQNAHMMYTFFLTLIPSNEIHKLKTTNTSIS